MTNHYPKFCVLIPSHAHVRNSHHHSRLNVGRYFGLKIVLNELRKVFGIIPDFVTYADVHKYDVVLVSIHSVQDYYGHAHTFYYHLKGKRKGIWIGGGSAVQNLPVLSEIFDFIFIGRAEGILIPFFTALLLGNEYQHSSIVNFRTYTPDKIYRINYVQQLYPEAVQGEKETMLGCKYNCAYCRYRISALPPTKRDVDNRTTMPGNEETFFDLHIKSGQNHTTSLDGLTEAIRFAVFKRIRNSTIVDKFREWAPAVKLIRLKMYLIVGYPGIPEIDFSELREVFRQVDSFLTTQLYKVSFHLTPFSAEPGTPMQWEPVNVFYNYSDILKDWKRNNGNVYHSPRMQAYVMHTTMSHYSVLLRSIHHRATLDDLDVIRYISTSVAQRSHRFYHNHKWDDLMHRFDLSPYYREYPIGSLLSSSQIHSWRPVQDIVAQAHVVRNALRSIASSSVNV